MVALTIPAKAEYMVLPRLALTGLARIRALEADTVADLKLALTEAGSNSIRHAYDTGANGNVEVRYELTDDKLAVEVTDDGDGFDPATMRAPSGELDEGGLGIAIIRALVDELDIGPRPDRRGSRLRFTKYLS